MRYVVKVYNCKTTFTPSCEILFPFARSRMCNLIWWNVPQPIYNEGDKVSFSILNQVHPINRLKKLLAFDELDNIWWFQFWKNLKVFVLQQNTYNWSSERDFTKADCNDSFIASEEKTTSNDSSHFDRYDVIPLQETDFHKTILKWMYVIIHTNIHHHYTFGTIIYAEMIC